MGVRVKRAWLRAEKQELVRINSTPTQTAPHFIIVTQIALVPVEDRPPVSFKAACAHTSLFPWCGPDFLGNSWLGLAGT